MHYIHHHFTYIAQSVFTSPDNKIFWVNAVLALITLCAVIVALFQERLKRFFNRAKLKIEIIPSPPDCHQIQLTTTDGTSLKSLYLRLRITNIGSTAAENVEIIPVQVKKMRDDGSWAIVGTFLPISLVWSHFAPATNVIRVPVGLFRHCDLGYLVKKEPSQDAMLLVTSITQPNQVAGNQYPNIFLPGTYRFKLLLSGDNVVPISKELEISFSQWDDNETIMLQRRMKITEVG